MNTDLRRGIIQASLFIATIITTTLAGGELMYGKSFLYGPYSWDDFIGGLQFSVPLLLILTVHEFGHYLTARYHKVKATLPFYIPLPPLPFLMFNIGTMGAVIRLKEQVYSRRQNFDIGVAGPLAGFVMAIIVLFYGFTHLPEPEYIFNVHPEYKAYGLAYADHVYQPQDKEVIDLTIGDNLLFLFFKNYVADPARMPNAHEIYHYPIIFAGYMALFFTFLNLLPVGQLDGGHVVYGLFGLKKHRIIATVFFVAFTFYGALGFLNPTDFPNDSLMIAAPLSILFLYNVLHALGLPKKRDTLMYAVLMFAVLFVLARFVPQVQGYSGFLFFAFIVGRFVGIQHPPSLVEEPLDFRRKVLGWIAVVVFIICFTPAPLQMAILAKKAMP
ncbi:site-2 protease family protein [Chryseolinea lacunae]|uniref:Site-2 protease family protein n=1 Tax=Chryseolinea lacunae TaxID=2801331 RepID=A0ABS1KYQ9_9BACT|nr:site-2 protease family protein [Chryseolinea lacunae]MBL0744392.1 site-2 protease family protein [Chryseolinea lacunae]